MCNDLIQEYRDDSQPQTKNTLKNNCLKKFLSIYICKCIETFKLLVRIKSATSELALAGLIRRCVIVVLLVVAGTAIRVISRILLCTR